MADLITLADTITVKSSYLQPLIEAIDVSAYDSIDFQATLLSITRPCREVADASKFPA